jgi:hypothetical protein
MDIGTQSGEALVPVGRDANFTDSIEVCAVASTVMRYTRIAVCLGNRVPSRLRVEGA